MTSHGAIFLPHWEPERLVAFARRADEGGLDELWLWEDCFATGGISTSALALSSTTRITVGIGVLPVPLRNVALTAMEAATLARTYPGRFHLGVGHGVLDWMGQVGVRAASPMTLLREYVSVLRALLAGQTVTAEGDYVRMRDVTLDWPPAQPPLLSVGAKRPKTLALAAELSDGVILTDEATVADVEAARAVLDGAGPDRRMTVFTMRADSVDATVERVQERVAAGADAVILNPRRDDDPEEFLQHTLEVHRP